MSAKPLEPSPTFPSEIIALVVLIIMLVLLLGCKHDQPNYQAIADEIAARDAKIATLEELAHNYHQDYLKAQSEKDSILAIRPQRRVIMAALPKSVRDSLFEATTDTVDVPKDQPKMIESFRVTAANVLFSDLAESRQIIGIQDRQIANLLNEAAAIKDANIELKGVLGLKDDIIAGQQAELSKANKRADKSERKVKLWKIAAPVAFLFGLLL